MRNSCGDCMWLFVSMSMLFMGLVFQALACPESVDYLGTCIMR